MERSRRRHRGTIWNEDCEVEFETPIHHRVPQGMQNINSDEGRDLAVLARLMINEERNINKVEVMDGPFPSWKLWCVGWHFLSPD